MQLGIYDMPSVPAAVLKGFQVIGNCSAARAKQMFRLTQKKFRVPAINAHSTSSDRLRFAQSYYIRTRSTFTFYETLVQRRSERLILPTEAR